ncbi:MAG: TIGR02253 family HAD-type hydrolase [Planctomycetes bacterium]|nr:TIGR02253 family HAD-type hydrolase [Planctomycetota bacterium]
MSLRAVLFDIDDTLFATTAFAAQARRRAVEAMVLAGLDAPVDAAYAELCEVVREFSSNYSHHFDKLVVRLGTRLRPGVHRGVVIAAGVCAYHATKEHLKPFADAVRILDALGRTPLLRGVLTNGLTIKQAEKLVRLGLQNAFSPGAIFISEELGVAKPHPRIFHIACEAMGVEPGEALYVGDSPLRDIDPAHEAGLITCLRKGEGGHAREVGVHRPDLAVDSLDDLVVALRERFQVPFADRGARRARG